MKLDFVTLFPESLKAPLNSSIMARAQKNGAVEFRFVDLREFATDRHRCVDDTPAGGGPGMLLKPDVLCDAVDSLLTDQTTVVLLSPQGHQFSQPLALEMVKLQHIVFVCAQYEGVDERFRQTRVDMELSIGDYVLTNGNLAAMVITDAVVRLLPDVLGSEQSAQFDSFSDDGLLDHPQFTKPIEYRGMAVPPVLLSGNHEKIAQWRQQQAFVRSVARRPDLFGRYNISQDSLDEC